MMAYEPMPTKQDWIDYIGLMRVIVRCRYGVRFKSLKWAQ